MVEAAAIKRDRSSNVCLELFVSFDLPVNGSAQLRYLSVWRGHGFHRVRIAAPRLSDQQRL
jgi:hypothetical protein